MVTNVVVRRVARVILIDERQRILLFRALLGRGERWIMPGGGVEQGETHRQAALRELREETGITDAVLGPCVWRRRFHFQHEGATYDQRERYFVSRTTPQAIDIGAWDAEERRIFQEWRWWLLPQIESASDHFEPSRLAALALAIVNGMSPPRPLAVGE